LKEVEEKGYRRGYKRERKGKGRKRGERGKQGRIACTRRQ